MLSYFYIVKLRFVYNIFKLIKIRTKGYENLHLQKIFLLP